MKLTLSFWPPIHKFLVRNQKKIQYALLITAGLVGLTIPAGFYLFTNNLELFVTVAEFAGMFGTIALYLFLLTLIPGIFQRFKVFPLFTASIILFRRQIGILMFLVAAMHSMYISTIAAISSGQVGLEFLPSNAIYGTIALLILLPVWLTSNDFSQKRLGPFWKTLQRLTYFALIAIFVHVALVERSAALATATVLTLEIASWIWKKMKSKSPVNQED